MLRVSWRGKLGFIFVWLVAAAASLGAQLPGGSAAGKAMKNPVARTAVSIKAGESLFQKNCVFCHGPQGLGDGKLAPKGVHPANLTDETWVRGASDGEIHEVILNGAGPDFKMRGVKGRLSETDIWNLVNYVRTLAKTPSPLPKPSTTQNAY